MNLSDSVRFALSLAAVGHRVVLVAPGRVADVLELVPEDPRIARVVVSRGCEAVEFAGGGRVRLVSSVLAIRGMTADEVFVPARSLPAAFVDIVPALAPGGDVVLYEVETANV